MALFNFPANNLQALGTQTGTFELGDIYAGALQLNIATA